MIMNAVECVNDIGVVRRGGYRTRFASRRPSETFQFHKLATAGQNGSFPMIGVQLFDAAGVHGGGAGIGSRISPPCRKTKTNDELSESNASPDMAAPQYFP
jgi:hypothetical protein